MPNPQLDQFMDALEAKVVPVLLLATIGAGLLSLFLKWLEHSLVRKVRSIRDARQTNKKIAAVPAASWVNAPPHCPSCNASMVKRTARRGANAGSDFWGCSNYPNCRGTRAI
jgi:Topoisomerase DNA binding C4 zinc finger